MWFRRLLPVLVVLLCPAPAQADPYDSLAWQYDGDGPMGMASAWRHTTGGGVTVAVLDTGADLAHPDLAPNLWVNPGEVPGNGADDDHNGRTDDVHGWDFVGGDGDPSDDSGHGTHVAGIAGARGGNGIGVAGAAWDVRLMVVKVLDARGRGRTDRIARGLRYAVDQGARIVNLSIATRVRSRRLRAALAYAERAGVLVVAAAGNGGDDLGQARSYPASFRAPNVVTVASAGPDGRLSPTSNHGRGVDLAAPGTGIVSTARGGGYEIRSGTSMAAPLVTGVAALVATLRPDARWPVLKQALIGGARAGSLPVGAGSLDAARTLRAAPPPP